MELPMTDNRRPTDRGTLPSTSPAVKAQAVPSNTCGSCCHFLVVDCYPDPQRHFCASEDAKDLTPRRHWLVNGPDHPSCQFFLSSDLSNSGWQGHLGMSMEERLLTQPDHFVDVKAAADLLKKSPSTIYALVDCGKLDCARVGGTIHVYKPSLHRFATNSPNGRIHR